MKSDIQLLYSYGSMWMATSNHEFFSIFGLHSFESMPIVKQLVQGSVVPCRHIGVGLSRFVSVVEFTVASQALLGLSE